MIIQGGIKKVVFNYHYDSPLAKYMFAQTDIQIYKHDPVSGQNSLFLASEQVKQ